MTQLIVQEIFLRDIFQCNQINYITVHLNLNIMIMH